MPIATTAQTGAISSTTNFSKVGNVKSVFDGSGFGGVVPFGCDGGLCSGAAEMAIDSPTPAKLSVQLGQNDLNYSVTVEYFVR